MAMLTAGTRPMAVAILLTELRQRQRVKQVILRQCLEKHSMQGKGADDLLSPTSTPLVITMH